jgi:hypothetical protein
MSRISRSTRRTARRSLYTPVGSEVTALSRRVTRGLLHEERETHRWRLWSRGNSESSHDRDSLVATNAMSGNGTF